MVFFSFGKQTWKEDEIKLRQKLHGRHSLLFLLPIFLLRDKGETEFNDSDTNPSTPWSTDPIGPVSIQ